MTTFLDNTKLVIFALAAALLTACGGGGGGGGAGSSGPVASKLTFDASSGVRSLTASGQSATFSVSSSNGCTGSASYAVSAANTSTTFEGQPALSSTAMLNINYTNCIPSIISSTTTGFYTVTNYIPLGASGDKYLLYSDGFNVPSAVKVGDVGIFGNALRYTNSTKTTADGSAQLSYVVEADTENTAFITIATKGYNASNVLELTQLTKYRINSANALSLISINIQYANGVNVVLSRA